MPPADRAAERASKRLLPAVSFYFSCKATIGRSFVRIGVAAAVASAAQQKNSLRANSKASLSVVVWRRKVGNNKEGRKRRLAHSRTRNQLFSSTANEERTKAGQSVKTGGMAAFLVASLLQLTPPPLLVLVRHHHAKSGWRQVW